MANTVDARLRRNQKRMEDYDDDGEARRLINRYRGCVDAERGGELI